MAHFVTQSLPVVLALGLLLWSPTRLHAQTSILPLGDSITHGGQDHASYRYSLYFDLIQAGYPVDFVGTRSTINTADPPNATSYPDYLTTFDRQHEGYWGYRTDQIAGIIDTVAAAAQPDLALVHLGTNDVGQNGAAGVASADTNLRFIIGRLRLVNASVAILLARVIPIAPGTSYFNNAPQITALNAVIDQIALDLDTPQSPVVTVDMNSGFVTGTMLQADGLHPNTTGENWLANQWLSVLASFLVAGNPPPSIDITTPADGAGFVSPAPILIAADASDPNGSVSEVRFYQDAQLLGSDTSPPDGLTWMNPAVGSYVLTAVAEDDEGATTTSAAVSVQVVTPGTPIPISVSNPGFEIPMLADSVVSEGPGDFTGWDFAASATTYLGIFNPPSGSYPSAGGNGTPTGAEGANVAYLFNNGGPAEFVEATQLLTETLAPGQLYELRVAIGRFLPGQPYASSTYGGYHMELIAGSTVIASDTDSVDPPVGEFADALASVSSDDLDPALLGQALSIRLALSTTDAQRSSHFDDVRLTRTPVLPVPALSLPTRGALLLALVGVSLAVGRVRRSRALVCGPDPAGSLG